MNGGVEDVGSQKTELQKGFLVKTEGLALSTSQVTFTSEEGPPFIKMKLLIMVKTAF